MTELQDVVSGVRAWHVEQTGALKGLANLPDNCVQCVCTSPPYFNLRKYKDVNPSKWPAITYQLMPGSSEVEVSKQSACLGNEKTVEDYIGHLVSIFREVWRVLRDDGVCFVNLGDSHKGAGLRSSTLKQKDLFGVPWRFAFAMQADGWYLRQNIVWQKVSPMPGSQKDRPTTASEDIFLLTKKQRYYYDIDACRQGVVGNHDGHNLWNWWDIGEDENGEMPAQLRWLLSSEPARNGHYASFPSLLPWRCIKLGTSVHGACSLCGNPYRRVTKRTAKKRERPNEYTKRTGEAGTGNSCANTVAGVSVVTLGWEPGCACDAPITSCLVLDPFSGTATTGVVARSLGRRYIGFEPSPLYIESSRKRLACANPLDDVVMAAQGSDKANQSYLFGDEV